MGKIYFKKGIVIGIILLFFGTIIIPSINSKITNFNNKTTSNTYEKNSPLMFSTSINNKLKKNDNQISKVRDNNDDILDQYQHNYTGTPYIGFMIYDGGPDMYWFWAQSFKPTLPTLTRVRLYVFQFSSNPMPCDLIISIRSSIDGPDLTSISKTSSEIPNWGTEDYTWFDFPDLELTPEQKYFIVATTNCGEWPDTAYLWAVCNDNPYNRGETWSTSFETPGEWVTDGDWDFCFETYGRDEEPPVADFTWSPENPTMNQTITFDASDSYDPDGDIVLYEWDWNNDGVFDESHTVPTATHSWSSLGNYPVTLRVTDNSETTDSVTKIVNIIYILVPYDFPTIQDAVNYSETSYYILVDEGTYHENIVIDVELLTLKPLGNKGEVVIDGGGIDSAIRLLDSANGVSISGFTIKNSGSGNAGISVESGFNDIWDNKIIQNDVGLKIFRSSTNQLHDNIIQNNRWGVDIGEHSCANIIKNNDIKSNTDHGIIVNEFSTGNLIQGNSITDNVGSGILIVEASKGNLITYNDFERNLYGIFCIYNSDANLFHHNSFIDNTDFNAWDSSVDRWDDDFEGNYWDDYTGEDNNGDGIGDTPYYVPGGDNVDRYPLINPPFSDQILIQQSNRNYEKISFNKKKINQVYVTPSSLDTIYVPYDYPTIKSAVDNSSDYDTIIVKPGTYNENDIVVDKPLTIIGENADADVIVDGNNMNYHVFLVTADNVDISGFTIKNTNPGRAGVMVMGNFSDIHDNVFMGCGSGVEVLGRFDKIHDIVIKGNTISGNKWGVYVSNCIDSRVENNGNIVWNVNGVEIGFSSIEILDNTVKNSEEQGIIQQFSNNVVIRDNELSLNGFSTISEAAAIQILNSENCLVDNNVISNNYKDGILVYISLSNNIENNNIIDNSGCPLLLAFESSGNIVENNVIQTGYEYGVTIRKSNSNSFYKNDITNINNLDCITFRTSCNNIIENNNFLHSPLIRNSMGGFRLYSSSFDNLCFHNNFYGGCDANDECGNSWDDTYFCGNYWENYHGVDGDGDGIGDDHYDIFGGSRDDYPLMYPWDPPGEASKPVGEINVKVGEEYIYSSSASDPNGFQVCYGWDWDGDLVVNDWTPFYDSGKVVSISHMWHDTGSFQVSVIVKNERGQVSVWSDSLKVNVPRSRFVLNQWSLGWFSRFTQLFQILRILLQRIR